MSIGVGLGAFVEGFSKGYGIRRQIEQDKLDREQKKRDQAWQDEQRTFEREKMDYARETMSDTRSNRQALKDIDTAGRAEFDKQVDAGKAEPDQWETFWKTYILPKRVNEYMRQGDIDSAKKLQDWGESEGAIKGGKLFSSALLKSQTGDFDGALKDVIEAGKVKGYIDHGMEVLGHDPIADNGGNVVGFRLRIKGADGETLEQDIATADMPKLIATFANPEAAWNSQLEANKTRQKQKDELSLHRGKKEIDKELNANPAADYQKARAERMKNDLDFAGLSTEEQDRIVQGDLQAGEAYAAKKSGLVPGGAGSAPAAPGKIIVDTATGEPVPLSPKDSAPGLQRPAGAATQPAAGIAPTSARPQAAPAAPAPRPFSRADMLRDAADHMANQGNPEAIAQRLLNAGIPEEEWPEPVRQAMRARAGQTAPGVPGALQLAR